MRADDLTPPRIMSYDEEMKLIVEAIKKYGPKNISAISRATGLPAETIRYRIKNQLKEMGIRFHVSINYLKLGLVRSWLFLDFSLQVTKIVPEILDLLAKRGYLTYYARVIPHGYYIAMPTIPYSALEKYKNFLDELVRLDILKEYRMTDLQYLKHLSLRSEFYDFTTRTWNVPWSKLDYETKQEPSPIQMDYSRVPIDKIDLLILKEFQINASQSLTSIAKKINVPEKQVRYHYKTHIEEGKIIENYIVRWQADRYQLTNKYILSCFIEFSDLTKSDVTYINSILEKFPFTWMIAISVDRTKMVSQIFMPISQYYDALTFLSDRLYMFKERFKLHIIDYQKAEAYTIPYESFNDNVGWFTDLDEVSEALGNRVKAKFSPHLMDYVEK
ncbi:MAG: AsnC family transcriptional regulator [Nitrososphaeria archaeon]|nr:AsnC family transcriptional regulator [Nitrososphaeria archaeon]